MEGTPLHPATPIHHRDAVALGTRSMRLLSRVLRLRRMSAGFDENLLDEAMAYQLVWPD